MPFSPSIEGFDMNVKATYKSGKDDEPFREFGLFSSTEPPKASGTMLNRFVETPYTVAPEINVSIMIKPTFESRQSFFGQWLDRIRRETIYRLGGYCD